jgi:hypothetical protein
MTTKIDDFKTRETKRMPMIKSDERTKQVEIEDNVPTWAD